MGRLIPAGSGFRKYSKVTAYVEPMEEEEELPEEEVTPVVEGVPEEGVLQNA